MATLGMDLAQLRAGGILVQVLLMAYVDTAYACSWGIGALGHALGHWGMHWGIGALGHALGHWSIGALEHWGIGALGQ